MTAILIVVLLVACLIFQWANYRNAKIIESELRWVEKAILDLSRRVAEDSVLDCSNTGRRDV
jgi:hypothetical protein